jgi:beta-N-acetylhexosaminidase
VSKFNLKHPWQFTSIDQEGGSVIRLSGDIAPPLSAATIGKTKNPKYAKTNALLSGNQLRAAGIDVVFAPVADVRTSKTEATLAARTLSSNPALVSKLVVAQIRGYAQSGVMPGIKHFPGLGGISADTHFAAGVYKGDVATLCRTHIQPFHAAIASGAPMVMIGHASYKPFGENPATANPKILKDLLRAELGFTGIAITDSMSMAAAKTGMKVGQNVYVRALRSGIDLLLMPGNAVQAKAAVGKALANGNLDVAERRLSIARVIAHRIAFERVASSLPASEPGSIQLKKAALDFQKIVLRNL